VGKINQKKKKLTITYFQKISMSIFLYQSHSFVLYRITTFTLLLFLSSFSKIFVFLPKEGKNMCVCVSGDKKEKDKCREYFLF